MCCSNHKLILKNTSAIKQKRDKWGAYRVPYIYTVYTEYVCKIKLSDLSSLMIIIRDY